MAANSKIEWTHHTFNPWWGCTKVSPACKLCYAEVWARRVGQDIWGKHSERRFFGEKHWQQPLLWEADAKTKGVRRRVFCASMADVFEDRRDLDPWREKLWPIIAATPHLDWLLLTKRPEHAARLAPWKGTWPENVWFGTTVETQHWANKRLPHLAQIPARIKFLSCEPLLGHVSLGDYLKTDINWVIAGGESGGKSRPTKPEWFRSLRDQCRDAGVAFHFKQWGNWAPDPCSDEAELKRFAKSKAGRLLDGETWDGLPA